RLGEAAAAADPRAAARAALDAIRARSAAGPRAPHPPPSDPAGVDLLALDAAVDPRTAPDAVAWDRVPLLDGVELHVRRDVRLPATIDARQRLLDHVVRQIVLYAQGRD
ncbi:MAG: hypothetical protein RI554_11370, partial [Trueperaceae bacterium]|nr:hypothetical protein [Trueperaceae bacterium]